MKFKNLLAIAALIAAIVCVDKTCFALDKESVYSDYDRKSAVLPDDINWQNKDFVKTDENGRKVRYVLNDKRVSIYIGSELIWQSDINCFVQDMFVADIDPDENRKKDARINNKSKEEIVLLIWKEGRFGNHRPFWVNSDEKEMSQHIFAYNIAEKRVYAKWGSSYMGDVYDDMIFKDNTLFLKDEKGSETAWQWVSFGFEKLEDVKFFVAGDNLIHEPIYVDALNKYNGNFDHIYKGVSRFAKDADISVINLETPLVNDEKRYSTYPCFGSPITVAQAIGNAGFNVVTLSNNHRFDKGASGIDETLKALDDNGILHVGSMDDEPYLLIKRNNIIFALMNYTYGTNGIRPPKGYENGVNYLSDEKKIREDIRKAKENSDFVIVFAHWGTEYMTEPDSYEKKWRDVFYEEGVDVVVGTHPHVYQKYEMYKSGDDEREMLLFYSLGNYISANQRKDHNTGGVGFFDVNITTQGAKVTDYDFKVIDTIYKSPAARNK